MAKPRLTALQARVSGAAVKNPQRLRGRSQPQLAALGAASAWLKHPAKAAWATLTRELPWLTEADRALVEIAATIRGRMVAGEDVGVSALNQLRMCLAQMGATPVDRSKITLADEPDPDPSDSYLN